MTLQERSPKEIKAYVDGYNACYKKFCELLDEKPERAKAIMGANVSAVNLVSELKGENKCQTV